MAKHRKRRASPNWKIARRQYEEGLSVEEIAREHGVRAPTVQKRIVADGWVSQETICRRVERQHEVDARAAFVTQQAEAILDSLVQKHQTNTRILKFVDLGLGMYEDDLAQARAAAELWDLRYPRDETGAFSEKVPDLLSDPRPDVRFPSLHVRRLALITQTVSEADSKLAGLKEGGDGWRSSLRDMAISRSGL